MNHKDLVRLIRKICREEIHEVLDEHLDDYLHEEKPLEEHEKQG